MHPSLVMGVDSHQVQQYWADRSGEYSPEYYAHHGPNKTSEAIYQVLDRFVDRETPVLELGCSAGRHLAYLHEHGFENLAGIEVNADAWTVMTETYPELATDGTFYFETIEAVIDTFDDNQFGAVYAVETLQHLHPSGAWVFEELRRITDDMLIVAEKDGETDRPQATDPDVTYVHGEVPLYARDWHALFTEQGFVEVDTQEGQRNTVRAFRTAHDPVDEGT